MEPRHKLAGVAAVEMPGGFVGTVRAQAWEPGESNRTVIVTHPAPTPEQAIEAACRWFDRPNLEDGKYVSRPLPGGEFYEMGFVGRLLVWRGLPLEPIT